MDECKKREILDYYCGNQLGRLKKICMPFILRKGIPQMHHDDLYSNAMVVLLETIDAFDEEKGSFEVFLVGNIKRSFYDWTRDMKRWKRCNLQRGPDGKIKKDKEGNPIIIPDLYLESTVGECDMTLGETIASDFDLEQEIKNEMEEQSYYDGRIEEFLGTLRGVQRKILEMLMDGHPPADVKAKLGLSNKEYEKYFMEIRSFKNMRELKKLLGASEMTGAAKIQSMEKNEGEPRKENGGIGMVSTQTAEKSKSMTFKISEITEGIDDCTLRFDYPLQRESEQWTSEKKGNLISDILQNNPLPEIVLAEQIVNGIPIIWDLDGKQRCSICYSFVHDGFKISRKVRRPIIEYIDQIRDAEGKPVLDKGGYPLTEYKKIDIRNKKFSQLPKDLQKKFLGYTFKCDKYLNASSEDIAYHIIRYNDGTRPNKSQQGIMRIGEDFAAMVKDISAMPFFKEIGGYKVSDAKNGTINRVVVESIMASKYIDDWNKDQNVICEYLKDNASPEDFEDFEKMVDCLEKVVTDEVAEMFDSKSSFIYFALFEKFRKDYPDRKDVEFVGFLSEFLKSLHSKPVDGTTYDDLVFNKETGKSRATKDKYIVVKKISIMEELMKEFLNPGDDGENCAGGDEGTGAGNPQGNGYGNNDEIIGEESKNQIIDFIKENVKLDVEPSDVEDYYSMLGEYGIPRDSPLLCSENEPSLVALICYSFENDIDLDKWIMDYFKKNQDFVHDQKENYLLMKNDLEQYLVGNETAA